MMENVQTFSSTYNKYLEEYLLNGGKDHILFEAYYKLLELLDESSAQAVNLLDIHNQALKDVLGVRRDNDVVQWIYIERATEFLAQILIATDAFLLALREKVEIDPLTEVYNRLALERILIKMLTEARSTKESLTVAMIDIDNFKEVNDCYGHITGDEVLKQVSLVIRKSLRDEDAVVRYGGEEFLVLLPRTGYESVTIPLERIKKRIESEEFLPDRKKISISVGVSVYPTDQPENIEDLVRFADEAVYAAKAQGKNRIVFYRKRSFQIT